MPSDSKQGDSVVGPFCCFCDAPLTKDATRWLTLEGTSDKKMLLLCHEDCLLDRLTKSARTTSEWTDGRDHPYYDPMDF